MYWATGCFFLGMVPNGELLEYASRTRRKILSRYGRDSGGLRHQKHWLRWSGGSIEVTMLGANCQQPGIRMKSRLFVEVDESSAQAEFASSARTHRSVESLIL